MSDRLLEVRATEGGLDEPTLDQSRVPLFVRALFYASVVSAVLLRPPFQLGGGLATADVVIAGFVVAGWGIAVGKHGPAQPLLLRMLPWMWLAILASLIGLSHAGVAAWGVIATFKNTMPFVVVVVAYGVLRKDVLLLRRAWRMWLVVAALEAGYIVLAGAGTSSTRLEGTFGNPNYPAHYLTLTLIAAFILEGWRVRVLLGSLILLAVLRTGSFSPFPMLAAAGAFGVWRWTRRLEPALRIVARASIVVGLFGLFLLALQLSSSEFDGGSGLDSARLERSSASRFDLWGRGIELWEERPLGWGPGYVSAAKDAGLNPLGGPGEVHHEILDALIAGGLIAVGALVMMVRQLWREGNKSGTSHVLIVAIIAAGLFRQTLNFRHTALLLAIALAFDAAGRMDRESSSIDPGGG